MSAERPQPDDPVLAARRELHELTVLASALLRLATKVHARCDALRYTLGDVGPVADEEVDRFAPRGAALAAAPRPASGAAAEPGAVGNGTDEGDPAVLLAMSLAGEGMSREQIGDYLRQSFGMEDTDDLLDRVLPEE